MSNNELLAPSRKTLMTGIALLILLICAALISIHQQSPPGAVAADAPPPDFSSGRALNHLRIIARAPHPTGSAGQDEVRAYLLGELTAAGLQPEVQKTTVVTGTRASATAGTVQNVVARLRGTGGAKAVMLVSHYDSVPTGPGASDDGAAVAMMLETLRALKTGPPLRNDVIFLFTDGEEAGLLGARAFVDEHPWARDVGVVLNFEARGISGPSILFETSNQNGWLVSQFYQAAPYPVATSFAYEVYKRLPNDTDMTVFKEAGMSGLGFAYLEGFTHYHTRLDSLNNVDERSLQHHGSYALALTRHFGQLGLEATKKPNVVFFNLFGNVFIYYAESWNIILTLLVLLLFAGVVISGFKRRRLTIKGLLFGALAFLASLILAPLAVTVAWWLIRKLHRGYELISQGDTYNSRYYIFGFAFLAAAVTSAIYLLFAKKVSVENLAIGGLVWWLAAAIASGFLAPGGSYLLAWPLLFSLVGLLLVIALSNTDTLSTKHTVILTLLGLPGVVLLSPLFYQAFIALSLRMAGVAVAIFALMLGLLIPFLVLMSSRLKWLWPGALALISIGFIAAGSLTSGFDSAHSKPYNLFYALNADTNKAMWGSSDDAPNEWTGQFFPGGTERNLLLEFFPSNNIKFLTSPAPSASLAAPDVQVLEDSTNQGARTLRLRAVSARRAPYLMIYLESNAKMTRLLVNGKEVKAGNNAATQNSPGRWTIRYFAPPEEGVELLLGFDSAQPIKIRAIDRSYGYTEFPGAAERPRPDDLMPSPFPYSDTALVSKSFAF
jgi:MFS family permease